MRTSHGNIVGVMSKSCQLQLGCVVMDEGWEVTVRLGVVEELGFLVANLAWFNGQHMQTVEARTKGMSLVQRDRECLAVEGTEEDIENLICVKGNRQHLVCVQGGQDFQVCVGCGVHRRQVGRGFKLQGVVSCQHRLQQGSRSVQAVRRRKGVLADGLLQLL